jgi:hypothetical protein
VAHKLDAHPDLLVEACREAEERDLDPTGKKKGRKSASKFKAAVNRFARYAGLREKYRDLSANEMRCLDHIGCNSAGYAPEELCRRARDEGVAPLMTPTGDTFPVLSKYRREALAKLMSDLEPLQGELTEEADARKRQDAEAEEVAEDQAGAEDREKGVPVRFALEGRLCDWREPWNVERLLAAVAEGEVTFAAALSEGARFVAQIRDCKVFEAGLSEVDHE